MNQKRFEADQIRKLASLTGENFPLGSPGVEGLDETAVTPAIRQLFARIQAQEAVFFGAVQNINLAAYAKGLVLPVKVDNTPLPVKLDEPIDVTLDEPIDVTLDEPIDTSITAVNAAFGLSISRGLVTGHAGEHKYGQHPGLPSGSVYETIWDASTGIYPYNAGNVAMEIVSTSPQDDGVPALTGTQTAFVEGQKLDGTVTTETVTMNGINAVALANTYYIVYRVYSLASGSVGTNVGVIDVQLAGAGAVQARIQAGNGQTLMCVYRIPKDVTGYLVRWNGAMEGIIANAIYNTRIMFRPDGGSWRVQEIIQLRGTGTGYFSLPFDPPLKFDALTNIRVDANSTLNNTGAVSSFDIILVDN